MANRRDGTAVQEVPVRETVLTSACEHWVCWPIHWSGVWVGALAALAISLIFGLAGIALGVHLLGVENRIVDWSKFTFWALALSVFGAFLAFVAGGWIAAKIGGILRSESAMLHGAVAWLVSVPVFLVLGGLGAGGFLGSWYAGLTGTPAWAAAPAAPFERPDAPLATATSEEMARYRADLAEYRQNVRQWREESPRVTRNAALGAATALLLGLVGSVVGGWMASGEPMTFTYYRTRQRALSNGVNVPVRS